MVSVQYARAGPARGSGWTSLRCCALPPHLSIHDRRHGTVDGAVAAHEIGVLLGEGIYSEECEAVRDGLADGLRGNTHAGRRRATLIAAIPVVLSCADNAGLSRRFCFMGAADMARCCGLNLQQPITSTIR